METIKEDDKEIIVCLGVEKNGHIVVQTEEEELPVEVVQQVMNEVIHRIVQLNIGTKKELKIWRLIAILATAMMFLILLKTKGIL